MDYVISAESEMWMFMLGMFTVKRLWRNAVYLIEHKHLQRVKGFTIWWKLMKVGELASRNRGQADIVVIPLHCLIRVTLHQLESWGKKQHTVRNKGFSRHYSLSKSQETQIMACSHFYLVTETPVHSVINYTHIPSAYYSFVRVIVLFSTHSPMLTFTFL